MDLKRLPLWKWPDFCTLKRLRCFSISAELYLFFFVVKFHILTILTFQFNYDFNPCCNIEIPPTFNRLTCVVGIDLDCNDGTSSKICISRKSQKCVMFVYQNIICHVRMVPSPRLYLFHFI